MSECIHQQIVIKNRKICNKCGLILDEEPELASGFSGNEKIIGKGSIIATRDILNLSTTSRDTFFRLNKLNKCNYVHDKKVDILSDVMYLMDIEQYKQKIIELLNRMQNQNVKKVDNRHVVACCIYIFCRNMGILKSIDEIINTFEVCHHRISKSSLLKAIPFYKNFLSASNGDYRFNQFYQFTQQILEKLNIQNELNQILFTSCKIFKRFEHSILKNRKISLCSFSILYVVIKRILFLKVSLTTILKENHTDMHYCVRFANQIASKLYKI